MYQLYNGDFGHLFCKKSAFFFITTIPETLILIESMLRMNKNKCLSKQKWMGQRYMRILNKFFNQRKILLEYHLYCRSRNQSNAKQNFIPNLLIVHIDVYSYSVGIDFVPFLCCIYISMCFGVLNVYCWLFEIVEDGILISCILITVRIKIAKVFVYSKSLHACEKALNVMRGFYIEFILICTHTPISSK